MFQSLDKSETTIFILVIMQIVRRIFFAFITQPTNDYQTAVGAIVDGFNIIVDIPAANGKRQPAHLAGFGIDRGHRKTFRSATPVSQDVMSGEINFLLSRISQPRPVHFRIAIPFDRSGFTLVHARHRVVFKSGRFRLARRRRNRQKAGRQNKENFSK